MNKTVKIEHIQAFNFVGALRGMRNPLQSWDKSDTFEIFHPGIGMVPSIGPNDLILAMKLARAGDPHAKFRRQIIVSMDLIAPWLFWKEYATYKVGTVENSTSQMFTLGNRLLTKDDFFFTHKNGELEDVTIDKINMLIEAWWNSGKRKGSIEWHRLIEHIPASFIYLRTCALNYEVLANMYKYRAKHKLQEWRDILEILEKELPYSCLWTLKE